MDATLVLTHRYGKVYYAQTRRDTAPGWSAPLGKKGFWYCTNGRNEYIGSTKNEYKRFIDAFLAEM